MADSQQLKILKNGVKEWNEWRGANPGARIDFSKANLRGAHLSGGDFRGADLREVDLMEANLGEANFARANLSGSILLQARLRAAFFRGADLTQCELRGADLAVANLRDSNLSRSVLVAANLNHAFLVGARFSKVRCRSTSFGFNDLSKVIDIEKVVHEGPSILGVDTLRLSKGLIPESFLRGCGLSDWEIESAKLYSPDLSSEEIINIQNRIFELKGRRPLQISSLFISYSRADGAFVDKLEPYLNDKGIRFWRDVHHAAAGRLEKVIDRAMRLNPTVLLVLSKDSIQSDWVEHEVSDARNLEKELGRDMLCPVALDDAWKKPGSWSQVLLDQVKKYNILDFSQWNDDSKFKAMFGRLVEGLDLFYKK